MGRQILTTEFMFYGGGIVGLEQGVEAEKVSCQRARRAPPLSRIGLQLTRFEKLGLRKATA